MHECVDATHVRAAQAGNPKLTLSLATQNLPSYENWADSIKASLANIGITVNIVPINASNSPGSGQRATPAVDAHTVGKPQAF